MFEMNIIMLMPPLGVFNNVYGLPNQNKNVSLHQTKCLNVLSDISIYRLRLLGQYIICLG